jgi:hypothetical protein
MAVGIVVFGIVFLAGLALGTRTRYPLAIAGIVGGAFCALIALAGLVVDSVRETVGLLLGR